MGLAQRARLRGAAPGAAAALRSGSPRPGLGSPASRATRWRSGDRFLEDVLPGLLEAIQRPRTRPGAEPVPLAGGPGLRARPSTWRCTTPSACSTACRPTRPTTPVHERRPRRTISTPADGIGRLVRRAGIPRTSSSVPAPRRIPAWHLVGGKDPIDPSELTGTEPDDGYPVLLRDWIRRDGLKCLKVKLRGDDAAWDYDRLVKVGQIAVEEGVDWLTADFNCTVARARRTSTRSSTGWCDEHPRLYGMILYVEQPFPYDLEAHRIDVHSVSARKPLFMDESATTGTSSGSAATLGWTGVALKTCKTQTGALLSLCWAKAHGMTLMVQDLSNPMLAQIPHVLLAAHAGTIMGVESNGMQFYPDASLPEAAVHPGL